MQLQSADNNKAKKYDSHISDIAIGERPGVCVQYNKLQSLDLGQHTNGKITVQNKM